MKLRNSRIIYSFLILGVKIRRKIRLYEQRVIWKAKKKKKRERKDQSRNLPSDSTERSIYVKINNLNVISFDTSLQSVVPIITYVSSFLEWKICSPFLLILSFPFESKEIIIIIIITIVLILGYNNTINKILQAYLSHLTIN